MILCTSFLTSTNRPRHLKIGLWPFSEPIESISQLRALSKPRFRDEVWPDVVDW
jgi:hypothetical protein